MRSKQISLNHRDSVVIEIPVIHHVRNIHNRKLTHAYSVVIDPCDVNEPSVTDGSRLVDRSLGKSEYTRIKHQNKQYLDRMHRRKCTSLEHSNGIR